MSIIGAKTTMKGEPTEKSESEISDVPKKTAASPKSSPKKQPAKAAPKPAAPPKSPVKSTSVVKKEEEPSDFPVGTKVFAQWLDGFYPAEIKGTDSFDRLKVFYVEDQKQKTVPKTAVVPLSKLPAGGQIMYSPLDPEAIGQEVEIAKPPTAGNDPKVSVHTKVTKEQLTVPWVQLYFTKQQKEGLVGEGASASATARRTVIKKSSK
ncbi:hypothetical protein AAVH_28467 [Aphelenchoides avenae]|nr:hypothetical protein AAVH_28467 [Aphelenchus avenae]